MLMYRYLFYFPSRHLVQCSGRIVPRATSGILRVIATSFVLRGRFLAQREDMSVFEYRLCEAQDSKIKETLS
jgi:hypothetical protein